MSKATTDLPIIDAYADPSVFDFLDGLPPALHVRVLGEHKLSKTVGAILEGYQQEGRKFETRRGNDFHDRYLVIDGSQVWSLGINGICAKAHTFARFDDDSADCDDPFAG